MHLWSVEWQAGRAFERFTNGSRRVLVLAQEEARLLEHGHIGTDLLLGLIHEGEGIAAQALKPLGVSLEGAREKVQETIGGSEAAPGGPPPFTPRAKHVLELALRESLQLGHDVIGTEHLLLGLVREGEGVVVQVLAMLGADPLQVRQAVIRLLVAAAGEPLEGDAEPPAVLPSSGGGVPSGAAPAGPPPARAHAGRDGRASVVAEVVVRVRRPEDFTTAYDQLGELGDVAGFTSSNLGMRRDRLRT